MNVTFNTPQIYANNIHARANNRKYSSPVSFKGDNAEKKAEKTGFAKAYENFTKLLAKPEAKIMENKYFAKFIERTKGLNMVAHLACLTSIVLSGFYIKKTLNNEKLDKQKRTTLAINQGAVAVLSGVLSYTADKAVNGVISKFIDRYAVINAKDEKLGKYLSGIKNAKTIMIFGLMYRFISPVLVTPIANAIGDRIQAKKEAQPQQA